MRNPASDDDWNIDRFAAAAEEAFAALPEAVRERCGELVIQVAEFPSRETLGRMQIGSHWDLLGLFHGVGMTMAGAGPWTGQMPNTISLYRQPILNYSDERNEPVADVINHVLVHEIGHHFGLSDDDMYSIDDEEE